MIYLYHLVQEKKMNLFWIARQRFIQGMYTEKLSQIARYKNRYIFNELKRATKIIIALTNDLTLGILKRDRLKYAHFENYLYEEVFKHLNELGRLCSRFR